MTVSVLNWDIRWRSAERATVGEHHHDAGGYDRHKEGDAYPHLGAVCQLVGPFFLAVAPSAVG